MAEYFPFVQVPENATVTHLSEDKPFLLLAIFAVASSHEKALQKSLGDELRKALCSKVILYGEKSLDLLQGLLIYLAWLVYFGIYK
jgi:hypothetical protein